MKRFLYHCLLPLAAWLLLVLVQGPAWAQQTAPTYCNTAPFYDASTNGSTRLLAAKLSGAMYICGYSISTLGTVNIKLVYGTGTSCGTGTVSLTPAFQSSGAGTTEFVFVDGSASYRGLFVPPGNDLCINTSAGISVQAIVYVYQQGQ
jgi:hypothetical protein